MVPFINYPVTTAVRAVLRFRHRTSEFAALHLPRYGHVTAPLPNGERLRMWSKGDDWIANQVFWRGAFGYEPETSRLFFEIARRSRVTLDIGAHVGYYALLAGHANAAGRVIAFEPLPQVFDRLVRNRTLNGLRNLELVRSAASDFDGLAAFYHVPMRGIPSSSSLSYESVKANTTVISTPVRVQRVDDVLAFMNASDRVDLVKLDTEGTEPEVLRGMARTLEVSRPSLICEVLPDDPGLVERLYEILRPLEYRFYMLTTSGPLPRERIVADATRHWRNHLFASPKSAAALGLPK